MPPLPRRLLPQKCPNSSRGAARGLVGDTATGPPWLCLNAGPTRRRHEHTRPFLLGGFCTTRGAETHGGGTSHRTSLVLLAGGFGADDLWGSALNAPNRAAPGPTCGENLRSLLVVPKTSVFPPFWGRSRGLPRVPFLVKTPLLEPFPPTSPDFRYKPPSRTRSSAFVHISEPFFAQNEQIPRVRRGFSPIWGVFCLPPQYSCTVAAGPASRGRGVGRRHRTNRVPPPEGTFRSASTPPKTMGCLILRTFCCFWTFRRWRFSRFNLFPRKRRARTEPLSPL